MKNFSRALKMLEYFRKQEHYKNNVFILEISANESRLKKNATIISIQ